MPEIQIFLDAEGKFQDFADDDPIDVRSTIRIGALPHGMQSGEPSVVLGFRLPDGQPVILQTSMKLFVAAAEAFKAEYGESWDMITVKTDGKEAEIFFHPKARG